MNEKIKTASLNIARDLCLKMIEKRSLSAEQLPGALSLLNVSVSNLMAASHSDGQILTVRLAREFCLKALERNQISGAQAASSYLAEWVCIIDSVTENIEQKNINELLTVVKDLVLKMLETGRITPNQMPTLFKTLVDSVKS